MEKTVTAMTDVYALFELARKQSPNPFRQKTVIADTEIWGEVMGDLSSLNQHIDQKIEQAISEVRQEFSNQIGIAIKGDRGTGKSHVIHRVWKKIEKQGGAVFAYIPPSNTSNKIQSHVRFHLSESFKHQDVHKKTQWQNLAVAAIETLKGTEYEEKYQEYLDNSSQIKKLKDRIKSNISKSDWLTFFDELAECILENQPQLDFHFLKSVLLSILNPAKEAQSALSWIRGDETFGNNELGLPHKSDAVWMIKQICQLAKVASLPVVICFDQLDSVAPDVDSGDSPAQTIARCIDQIYTQCSNVILLCCVISDTWREIHQMGSGIPHRVGQREATANPPSEEEMLELVRFRLNWFYKKNNLNLNDYPPLYPFKEEEIKKIANTQAGVRSLLEQCAKNFELNKPKDDKEDKNNKFQEIYNELLSKVSIPVNDDAKLADVINFGMNMILDEETDNVKISQIESIKSSSHNLHLIIWGYDKIHNQEVRIGVRVCETNQPKTCEAVMRRLLKYENYKITRGCLVRSTPIKKSWKVCNQLKAELEKDKGGEVVELKKDEIEIKSLLALETMYLQAENYGFEKEEVVSLIKELRLAANNTLLEEILSAPV
jgi:hypothetical protein